MKSGHQILTLTIFFTTVLQCNKKAETPVESPPLFDNSPTVVTITPGLNEVSGIADSKQNAGYLWGVEDSGNPTKMHLLQHNGGLYQSVFIKGAINRDWEEMAYWNGNIYVGDIGDNAKVFSDYSFYVFAEPARNIDTVFTVTQIKFRYPDGSHDAEAFVVEPSTGNIYIFTKSDVPSRIYMLPAPLTNSGLQTAQFVGELNISGVVGAALAEAGNETIIKTYTSLFYYRIANGNLLTSLQQTPIALPYQLEPQGEAVCFSNGSTGYFTLSEKAFAPAVQLYFYKRK